MKILSTNCCIAGGGPAGMMLGLLLARAGVEVIVLEKHADFLRDFRGDTVHPSTLTAISELGLLEDFLRQPHQKAFHITGYVGDAEIMMADFSKFKIPAPFIAMMPQWDFLNFLATHAKKYPNFKLMMQARIVGLIEENGVITGAKVETSEGQVQINSKLLIGADGRGSAVRDLAGLIVQDYGAPMDVLWFKISRQNTDTSDSTGRFLPGKIIALINREDYWQCGYVIPKGENEKVRLRGLDAFKKKIAEGVPFFANRVDELKDWDQIKLLIVKVDLLQKWYRPGLLCIGDAAHAMSPVGGVGINLAVQDAIAAGNILAEPLLAGNVTEEHLRAVQKRRTWPVKMTQRLQLAVQKNIIYNILQDDKPFPVPFAVKMLQRFPILRRIPAYFIGIGFRPEHVKDITRGK